MKEWVADGWKRREPAAQQVRLHPLLSYTYASYL